MCTYKSKAYVDFFNVRFTYFSMILLSHYALRSSKAHIMFMKIIKRQFNLEIEIKKYKKCCISLSTNLVTTFII